MCYFRVVREIYSFSGLPFFIWWGAHFEEMRAPGMKFGISLEGIFYSLLNTTSKAKSGDICFRCEKQGYWANECPEGHELERLANQNCFLCGKKGHLKEACPNKIKKDDHFKPKLEENKPPSVKPSWYQNSTSLIKLLGNLSVK